MVLSTFLKYFISDLPIILTGFFCMWMVLNIYLPKREKSYKWKTLIYIELFENLVVPLILFFILLYFDSVYAAIFFHTSLILFIFGFIGKILVKAKNKDEWLRIFAIFGFTYFFVFLYPFILRDLQWFYNFNGWFLIISTNLIFLGLNVLHNCQPPMNEFIGLSLDSGEK